MKPSRTIVRAWNKDGYHKDILVINVEQVQMNETRVKEPGSGQLFAGGYHGPSMVIRPADFPEMVEFQVIVKEYQ